MYEDVERAYQQLVRAVTRFNATWPSLVVRGKVWRLPVLQEQRTPDIIDVSEVADEEIIEVTLEAIGTFERDLGQAPGTVMRLPGYFQLSESVLPFALEINVAKKKVLDAIEAVRVAQNLTPEMRPRIMRRALGPGFSTKQLQRTLHAFDGAPRRISFTWAGHTTGNEKISVAKIRLQLINESEARAASEEIPVHETPEYLDLRAINHLADTEVLIKHKNVAPHPRCTIWFGEKGERWDATIKANLPVFVLAGEIEMKLSQLKSFNKAARGEKRRDVKTRDEVWPQRDIYMPTAGGQPPVQEKHEVDDQVPSTYRLSGVIYQRQ
ncbi:MULTISPECIES: DNA replication terminus site-binding protein [Pseudomonas]|uniref:DNA replication terminus site-binding protein n=1 Tax=Pseudomonas TaxID=286 RepID=UPI0007152CE9|nr:MULTISPECIES: replication terminus site-binding protein [Pseudomonas]KRP85367.1 replication terminus site-binding protein [Pseudomonas lactis]